MKFRHILSCAVGVIFLTPNLAMAQSVNVTHGILPDRPYTIIYPDAMVATGGAGEPLIINHPNAPLQCTSEIVPVEDTGWTAQSALDNLDTAEIAKSWADRFPGFAVTAKSIARYQSGDALLYEGTSTDSPMGEPLTMVHTETVDSGRGYTLECMYATKFAEQARPIVDFIITNFSTKADAECCIGLTTDQVPASPAQ